MKYEENNIYKHIYEVTKAFVACLDTTALSEDELEGLNYLREALAKAEGK